MERYSEGAKELNDIEVHANCSYSCYSNIADALQTLEAYEDTGLTPEEAVKLHTLIRQQGEELQRRDVLIRELDQKSDYWECEAKKWCDKGFNKKLKCYKIEKEHNKSTLMNRSKKDLVEQIMCLVHNNNVLYNTINQQVENFKTLQRDMYNNLDRKSFKVDLGHNETDAVRLVDIEEEILK